MKWINVIIIGLIIIAILIPIENSKELIPRQREINDNLKSKYQLLNEEQVTTTSEMSIEEIEFIKIHNQNLLINSK